MLLLLIQIVVAPWRHRVFFPLLFKDLAGTSEYNIAKVLGTLAGEREPFGLELQARPLIQIWKTIQQNLGQLGGISGREVTQSRRSLLTVNFDI